MIASTIYCWSDAIIEVAMSGPMKSRVREFNGARDRNLAASYTNLSHCSSRSNLNSNASQASQSHQSSFLHKQKSAVCINCVNKKLISTKQDRKTNQQKELQVSRLALEESIKRERDPVQEIRSRMVKEADMYNRSVIGDKREKERTEKFLDERIKNEFEERERKKIEEENKMSQAEKNQLFKYRMELRKQKQEQELKKKEEKKAKLLKTTSDLNLKYYDKTNMIKTYAKDLKNQLETDKMKKREEKLKEKQLQIQYNAIAEEEFMKYTEFVNPPQSKVYLNPEDLTILQQSKSFKKLQDRINRNKEREEELIAMKRQQQLNASRQSLKMRQYAKQLEHQTFERQTMERSLREQEKKVYDKWEAYTQQILRMQREVKPCDDCSQIYDSKYLGPPV